MPVVFGVGGVAAEVGDASEVARIFAIPPIGYSLDGISFEWTTRGRVPGERCGLSMDWTPPPGDPWDEAVDGTGAIRVAACRPSSSRNEWVIAGVRELVVVMPAFAKLFEACESGRPGSRS